MAKIHEGDIFEIDTSAGKGYLHFIETDSTIGELVRILPGLYKEPPVDLEKIASSQERYMIFFPLKAAVRQKIVQ